MRTDTIFALASGGGVAGVAVIRVSGPGVREVLTATVGFVPEPRRAQLAVIRDPAASGAIDSGVILFFPGPASFTGEDVCELQLHGSLGVIRAAFRVLGAFPGFRMAEPGEFTRRAFEHGKMDLLDVEALGDLLAAETEVQARFARSWQTSLHTAAQRWRRELTDLLGLAEACIDFVDQEEVERFIDSDSERRLGQLGEEISAVAGSVTRGHRMLTGFSVVLAGPPNSGKSSLLNALAAREIAITSPIPGTTRDVMEARLDIGGYPVTVLDTAGLRESDDPVEREGVRRARAAAAEADLVIWLNPIDSPAQCSIPNALEVRSRADLGPVVKGLAVSAATGMGVQDLLDEIGRRAGTALGGRGSEVMVAHERQAARLRQAAAALGRAAATPTQLLELRAEELRAACSQLDHLVGRIAVDDILDTVFGRFCIGK